MFVHVDHVSEVDKHGHYLAAMYGTYAHPVAYRASVWQVGVASVKAEVDVPTVYDGFYLGPIWVVGLYLVLGFSELCRCQIADFDQFARLGAVHAVTAADGDFVKEVGKSRYGVEVGQIEILVAYGRNLHLDEHPFQVARRIEASMKLAGIVHLDLQWVCCVESPLCRVGIDGFGLSVLQYLSMIAFVVSLSGDVHGALIVVGMLHPCVYLFDAVRAYGIYTEQVAALALTAPIVGGSEADFGIDLCLCGGRHKPIGVLVVQLDGIGLPVALSGISSVAGEGCIEGTGVKRQCLLRCGSTHIVVVVEQVEVETPHDALLHDFGGQMHDVFVTSGNGLAADAERGLRIEIFGFERFLQVGREADPLVGFLLQGVNGGPVVEQIAFDGKNQQFVFAFLQAFDFDFLVLVVVDALQAAGYSAVFIDYVEFYPVVRGIGFGSLAGVGTVVLVAVAPQSDGRCSRLRL